VKVHYDEKDKRISHFRPFRDFSRISVLNTVLVTITLLYIKPRDLLRKASLEASDSDAVKATSVGFGIFMGILPIWGFQLVSAIALAVLLRLNKALVIIAANISIPPMIPLILFGSFQMGGLLMGDRATSLSFSRGIRLEDMQQHVTQYISGAITLAIVAGLFAGTLTFILLSTRRTRQA
jgi:uncharacterized protein (DUF2062 family)